MSRPRAYRRLAVAATIVVLALLGARPAAAGEAYVRVISQAAPVHSGPSSNYREIFVAQRGDVFEVLERGTKGYWFRVELEDGTTGWIFGELVFPFEVVEETDPGFFTRAWRGFRRAVLAPSPVPYADVEISVSAGSLDGEGLFLLRPAYMLDKYFALEGFMGLSPRGQEDLFLAGLGLTLLRPAVGRDRALAPPWPPPQNAPTGRSGGSAPSPPSPCAGRWSASVVGIA